MDSIKSLVVTILVVLAVGAAVSQVPYDRRMPAVSTEDGLDVIGKVELPTECAVVRAIEAGFDRDRNLVVSLACEMRNKVPFRTGEYRYNAIELGGQSFGLQRLAKVGAFRNGKWELLVDIPSGTH